jgi:hypothetical protein
MTASSFSIPREQGPQGHSPRIGRTIADGLSLVARRTWPLALFAIVSPGARPRALQSFAVLKVSSGAWRITHPTRQSSRSTPKMGSWKQFLLHLPAIGSRQSSALPRLTVVAIYSTRRQFCTEAAFSGFIVNFIPPSTNQFIGPGRSSQYFVSAISLSEFSFATTPTTSSQEGS